MSRGVRSDPAEGRSKQGSDESEHQRRRETANKRKQRIIEEVVERLQQQTGLFQLNTLQACHCFPMPRDALDSLLATQRLGCISNGLYS